MMIKKGNEDKGKVVEGEGDKNKENNQDNKNATVTPP